MTENVISYFFNHSLDRKTIKSLVITFKSENVNETDDVPK